MDTSTQGGTALAEEYYDQTCGLWAGQSKHWWIRTVDGEQGELPITGDGTDGGNCEEYTCVQGGGTWDPAWGCSSPIVIPLTNAQSFKLTSPAEGVRFDLDADGQAEQTAWTTADSKLGFLAIDRNGNGAIDDGTELFGNVTFPNIGNGFNALRRYMETLNTTPTGMIAAGDSLFDQLLLWEDANHNGISEPQELYPLGRYVARLGLGYEVHDRRDGHGNRFRFKGWVEVVIPGKGLAKDGQEHMGRLRAIYDVFFVRQ